MIEQEIKIINKLGLHVRAATKLVQLASDYDADISLEYQDQIADAKSIMDVLMLAAIYDTVIVVKVSSDSEEEEEEAFEKIKDLINNRFDEDQ